MRESYAAARKSPMKRQGESLADLERIADRVFLVGCHYEQGVEYARWRAAAWKAADK